MIVKQVTGVNGTKRNDKIDLADCAVEKCFWFHLIPPAEWGVYQTAIDAARRVEVPFLLGGAFGLAAYTGRWRNTKDLDLFIRPENRERLVAALEAAGFSDYHARLAYDRNWIYRAVRDDVIVDLIWQTPNRRSVVDDAWFQHSRIFLVQRENLQVVPAEELLWIKLYVLQRDRCDWPDVINLLDATGADLDWDRLLDRLRADIPLLEGALKVFAWVSPNGAAKLPGRIRAKFRLCETPGDRGEAIGMDRVRLLDSRQWYAAAQAADQPMHI
jgi:hypothetical protein